MIPISVLLLLLFRTFVLGGVEETCKCLPLHPQTAFCQANFVMKGTIISDRHEKLMETEVTKSMGMPPLQIVYYDVLVSRVHKGFEKISEVVGIKDSFLMKIPVYLSQSGAVCKFNLKKGQKYLIMGRIVAKQLQITHCSFVKELHTLSKTVKHGIKGHYDCKCPVTMCVGGYCDQDHGCKWNVAWDQPVDECIIKHKSCHQIPDKKNPSEIHCHWSKNSFRYNKCNSKKRLIADLKMRKAERLFLKNFQL